VLALMSPASRNTSSVLKSSQRSDLNSHVRLHRSSRFLVRSIDEVHAWGLGKSLTATSMAKLHFYYAFLTDKPGEVCVL